MQTNKTQRAFSNYCGSLFTGRHFELVGLRDSQAASKLKLPLYSSRITTVKVAADFRPAEENTLISDLEAMSVLAGVQKDHFNACGINDEEIRALLFGGHMKNCLDDVLRSLPVLLMTGRPVEALVPLDLVYDSRTDFSSLTDPGLAMEAFDAKARFYLNRQSKVFSVFDEQPKINYAVLFNDEPIEFRMAGKTLVQPFVLRLFSDHELLLEHLALCASLALPDDKPNILRFQTGPAFEHTERNRSKKYSFGFNTSHPERFPYVPQTVSAALNAFLGSLGRNLHRLDVNLCPIELLSKDGKRVLDICDRQEFRSRSVLTFCIRKLSESRADAPIRGQIIFRK